MSGIIKLGVIGDPINHSLSPKLHRLFAERADIEIEYLAFRVASLNLESFIKNFFYRWRHRVECNSSSQSRLSKFCR